MFTLVSSLLLCLSGCLRTRAALQLEIPALRHQVLVLRRSTGSRRLRLQTSDRVLWAWLSRLWSGWRFALPIDLPPAFVHVRIRTNSFGPISGWSGDGGLGQWAGF